MREVAWLVEADWPENNRPPTPQWWHPKHGWMWDANKALRFAREQDATDYIKHGKTGASWLNGKPREHVFLAAIADTHPKDGDVKQAPLVSGPTRRGTPNVKRLLREARSYVEQAGLRHHDVSGLLAEIDAVLLVSNRSGVERLKGVIYRNCDPFDATAEDARVIQEIANEMAALDIPTINEGEGQ